ncbi:MAG: tetratricopeptide repeat protein [Pyrinomonadaceae bacterium]
MKFVKCLVWLFVVYFLALTANICAQGGNSIGGHVFGDQRTPLEGITVDLLDDFSRTLSRVRTNSTGRFYFGRLPAGIYRVRVMPLGTNYQEQEQTVEIRNFFRTDSRGNSIATGLDSAQVDIYLRAKKDDSFISNETIFAQNVPERSQKLYEEAVDLLKERKSQEAYAKLIEAIEAFPEYYLAIELLGLEYVNSKHYQAAQILLQRAVQINPKSFRSLYGLAFTLYSLNLDADALSSARAALELNPSSVDALLLTGTLLRQTGSYQESESVLTKAKKLARKPLPEIHWQLALLYGNNLQRYDDAADELEQLLKQMPKDKDPEKIKLLIKTFRERSKRD